MLETSWSHCICNSWHFRQSTPLTQFNDEFEHEKKSLLQYGKTVPRDVCKTENWFVGCCSFNLTNVDREWRTVVYAGLIAHGAAFQQTSSLLIYARSIIFQQIQQPTTLRSCEKAFPWPESVISLSFEPFNLDSGFQFSGFVDLFSVFSPSSE